MATVFRWFCLLLVSLPLSCASSPQVKPTSPQADAQLVAPLLRAASKWAESDELRAKLLLLADANGPAHKSRPYLQELDALYQRGGREAVREFALSKGFYIPPEGVQPFGVFALGQKSAGAFTVKPAAVVGALPPDGFVAVDELGGQLLLVLSAVGFEQGVATTPAALAALRKDLERDWVEALSLLSDYAGETLPRARYQSECAAGGVGYGDYLRRSVGPAFAEFNARKTGLLSMGERVSLLARDMIRHGSACPYVMTALVGPLLSPTRGFGQSDVLYAANVALLGRLANGCRDAAGELDYATVSRCAWDRLLKSDAIAYRKFFETLGSTGSDWYTGIEILAEQSRRMEPEARRTVAAKALSLGLVHAVWFEVLGFDDARLPAELTFEVGVSGIYSDGTFYEDEKDIVSYAADEAPLPVLAAARGTRWVDACRVPLFWEDEWWRVCPLPSPVTQQP